jgi:hypothetical protein
VGDDGAWSVDGEPAAAEVATAILDHLGWLARA